MEVDAPLLTLVGIAVVATAMADLVWTTIGVGERRGPVSDLVARTTTRIGHEGRPTHRRRKLVGVLTAVAVPLVWLVLLWAGFALMFLSDDDAVLVSASQEPVAALGRLAYAAGGLAGAGAGLVAGTETWQLVNNVSALAGLALVTLSLTYLMQVVSGVVAERAVMSQVAGLGRDADDAVRRALEAPGAGTFPLQLVAIAEGISMAAQRHLAFPMLQYFHSSSRSSSAPVNLARYDGILTELERRTGTEHGPAIAAGRAAIDDFLATLRLHGESPDAERRTRLGAFVEESGWNPADR